MDWIGMSQWLHGTGPDLIEDMKYDETLAKQCYNLADRWDKARNTPTTFSPSDFANLTPSQRIVFLETLQDLSPSLPANLVAHLDEVYGVDKSKNAEIKLRFYGLALKSGDEYAEKAAGEWCG
jgi:leukotriene-A4 hydrolase